MIDQNCNGFCAARFGAFFRRYITEHSRPLLGGLGVTTGIMILLAVLLGRTFASHDLTPVDSEMNQAAMSTEYVFELMMFYIIAHLYVMLAGSLTFCSLKNKPRRITAMMLPAARSEKFLTVVIIYTLLADVGFIAGCVIADFAHSLASGLPMMFPRFLDWITSPSNTSHSHFTVVSFVILFILMGQAFFTFGSALWPRRSFIKTFCVLFIVQLLFAIFMPALQTAEVVKSLPFEAWMTVAVLVILCLYYLAWSRFKNMQLVQRLLTN